MYNQKKSFLFSLFIVLTFFACSSIFAQHDMNKHKMHKLVSIEKDSSTMKDKNPLVREGVINLKKIDVNKDGKVYQDQMDWNVISDKAGKCPLCGMTLKEVSLKEAKEALVKNGFKVE